MEHSWLIFLASESQNIAHVQNIALHVVTDFHKLVTQYSFVFRRFLTFF